MELQSLFSKENIREFDRHDGLAFPSAESRGDESTSVQRRIKVHSDSNQSQLESTDLLDEPIECSSTEVLHQGHKDRCNEDREEQVASGPCTDDIMEAATSKCIGSGVMLLPAEERSNLKDGQLNSKLVGTKVMESGLNCNKDVSKTSDNGSLASIVGKNSPSVSGLPKDSSTDHYLRQELLDGFSVERALESSAIFGEKIVSNVGGTIGNPSLSLATPDYKHEGALSEEAVRTMKNYAGTHSSNPRELLMELQALFSKENIEEFDRHDGLAFRSAESRGDESTVCHVEKLVDTLVSSEPGTYQGLSQDISRDEEKEGCMPVSLQDNEQEGVFHQHHKEEYHEHNEDQVTSGIHAVSKAAPSKVLESEIAPVQATATSALPDEQLNPEPEGDKIEKHSFSCEKDLSEMPNDLSVFKSAEESAICPDGSDFRSGICQPIGQKHIDEINPKLLSCDTGVLHKYHREECNALNEDKVTPGVPENDMSESAPVEATESAIMLLPVAEMSELPDEQLNPKQESDEGEEHSSSCDKDRVEIFCTGSVKDHLSHLSEDCHIDSCQKQDVPDELSVPKCPEESANIQDMSVLESGLYQTSGQKFIDESSMQLTSNIEVLNQDHEECNENNEGQITPGIPASGMYEAAQIEMSEMEVGLTPAAGTSALLDEQLNSKLEGNEVEEHNFSYNKDTSSLFDTELVEKSKASNLPKDTHMHPSSEHNCPNDASAPRSPEESKVFQNDSVSGSESLKAACEGV
uniref:Uncharacterized protein n=1 Tax=Arundo donax TaxID=35708 RepID=A0A0A9CM46_ARUDO